MPLGFDPGAAVYRVVTRDGTAYFLKAHAGPVNEQCLLVARALRDRGVRHVLTPIRTRSAGLLAPLTGDSRHRLVLYPFIRGESAMVAGLSDPQWRTFGATLRLIHDSGLESAFQHQLRVEDFTLPSAALVRRLLALVAGTRLESPVAARFVACWRARAERIRDLLARAEGLGRSLAAGTFTNVLCHADLHAGNILAGDNGDIHLVDWDEVMIAPRERDLLFVIGSTIARPVTPREQELFFAGYGPVAVNPVALAYFRYERIIEDLGAIGRSVPLDPHLTEESRRAEAELAISFFAPGGAIDRAEAVTEPRFPINSA